MIGDRRQQVMAIELEFDMLKRHEVMILFAVHWPLSNCVCHEQVRCGTLAVDAFNRKRMFILSFKLIRRYFRPSLDALLRVATFQSHLSCAPTAAHKGYHRISLATTSFHST